MRYKGYRREYHIFPLSIFGPVPLVLFVIVTFFLALPVFLAALVVFAVLASYLTWRVHKTMHHIETGFTRYREGTPGSDASSLIIDVTPGHKDLKRHQG